MKSFRRVLLFAAAGVVMVYVMVRLRDGDPEADVPSESTQTLNLALNEEADFDLHLHNPAKSPVRVESVHVPARWTISAQPSGIPGGGQALLSLKVRPTRPGIESATVSVKYAGREQPEIHEFRLDVSLPALPDPAAAALEWKGWKDSGLLTSATAAVAASGGALLADLRAPEAFQLGHAEGALSVTLPMLEGGTLFRPGRPVIVMEQGAAPPSLLRRLQELRTAGGHDVQLLPGGLRAWRDAGGRVVGSAVDDASLYTISAADLLALRGRPGWNVIPAEQSGDSGILTAVFGSGNPGGAAEATIISSEQGESYQQRESSLSVPGALYLAGGTSALLDQLRLSNRPRQSRRITVSHTSARTSRGVPSTGGSCCSGR